MINKTKVKNAYRNSDVLTSNTKQRSAGSKGMLLLLHGRIVVSILVLHTAWSGHVARVLESCNFLMYPKYQKSIFVNSDSLLFLSISA